MTQEQNNPERDKILQVYAIFGAGLLFSLIPFFLTATLAFLLIFGVLIAAYMIKSGTAADSLTRNHMIYIIRTIWIGSFISILTMAAASIYLFEVIDRSPLDPCIQGFRAMQGTTQIFELQGMMEKFPACITNYIAVNFRVFLIAGFIGAAPVLLYFILRFGLGLSRILKNQSVIRPRAWF